MTSPVVMLAAKFGWVGGIRSECHGLAVGVVISSGAFKGILSTESEFFGLANSILQFSTARRERGVPEQLQVSPMWFPDVLWLLQAHVVSWRIVTVTGPRGFLMFKTENYSHFLWRQQQASKPVVAFVDISHATLIFHCLSRWTPPIHSSHFARWCHKLEVIFVGWVWILVGFYY